MLADESLHIAPLKYQIRGILGLPVLRALGKTGISPNGSVRIMRNEAVGPGDPNLFFDELDPIIESRRGNYRAQMFLDSGANATFVYPSFKKALSTGEIATLRTKREETGGAGGVVARRVAVLPTLRLQILGRTVDLSNISLLARQPAGNARYRDGVIGMDALLGGFTLDFRAMQFRVD